MKTEFIGISTDDLVDELGSRFDHWIFAGMREVAKQKEITRTKKNFYGNHATCAGLCTQLICFINEDNDRTSETTEDIREDTP